MVGIWVQLWMVLHLSYSTHIRVFLVLTEALILKAIILLKPRILGRILDDIWGWFLFTYNVAFSFIVHAGQLHLGSFNEGLVLVAPGPDYHEERLMRSNYFQ